MILFYISINTNCFSLLISAQIEIEFRDLSLSEQNPPQIKNPFVGFYQTHGWILIRVNKDLSG